MKKLFFSLCLLFPVVAFALLNNAPLPFNLVNAGYLGATTYKDGQSQMMVGQSDGQGGFVAQPVTPTSFFGNNFTGNLTNIIWVSRIITTNVIVVENVTNCATVSAYGAPTNMAGYPNFSGTYPFLGIGTNVPGVGSPFYPEQWIFGGTNFNFLAPDVPRYGQNSQILISGLPSAEPFFICSGTWNNLNGDSISAVAFDDGVGDETSGNFATVTLSIATNYLQGVNVTTVYDGMVISNSVFTTPTSILVTNGDASGLINLPSGLGAGVSNVTFTITQGAAGSPPTATGMITNGTLVGVWQIPSVTPTTNAVYPTPILTLLDTNPIVYTGSNYLGCFTNVYAFTINTPLANGASQIDPAALHIVENLYASYDNTNFFIVTNNPCNLFTNAGIYLSVVGQSGTNYGEVVIQGMLNWQYAGTTYDLRGTPVLVADGGNGFQVVNYETVAAMIGNAGSALQANGLTFKSYNMNVLQFAVNPLIGPTNISLTVNSTNFVVSTTTNQAALYPLLGLLVNTNLVNTNGWYFVNATNYVTATNGGTVSFSMPRALVGNYGFFHLAQYSGSTIYAVSPFVAQGGLVFVTNTITTATNTTLGFGAGLMACDTKFVYLSLGTNQWGRIPIPTNTW